MRHWCVADSQSVENLARVAAALLIAILIPAFAHAAEPPFNIYYSGSEDLVLTRLLLDPSTHRAANLDDAATAVYQDNLPPPGPQLEALKARVASGMGVVLILGRHTDAAALASFTSGAIKQIGIVDVARGAAHGQGLEHIAAVVNWVGPKADPLARNISWLSAVRVHERSLLDANGAEALLGKGDMLYLPSGSARVHRLHAPLVTEKEIAAVVEFWKQQGSAEYQQQFLEAPKDERETGSGSAGGEGSAEGSEEDPLYQDAVKLVVEFGKASTSLLQRRLRIGYGRAAHLIDLMEQDGIVGAADGPKPREVLKRPDWISEIEETTR